MKAVRIVFIAIVFLLLAAPAAAMPFFSDAVNTEKRELSELPALIEEGRLNENFSEEMNTFVQEHIGFRGLLVSANSLVKGRLFGQSATESILVGRDGWLYYADTVNDYLHVATLSDRNVNNIVRSMTLLRDYAKEAGSDFVVAVIPNKNTLYKEAMPANYLPLAERSNKEKLEEALTQAGIVTADAESALRAEDRVLYQKTDSHWTYEGALTGYRAILQAAALEDPHFADLRFTEKEDWDADLAVSLYGEAAEKELQSYPDYEFHYTITSRSKNVDAISLSTAVEGENGLGSLVMYRDSFANTMQVYFAESFDSAFFSRALPYQAELIGKQEATLTVLEIVERNLVNLARRAPLMPAPEAYLQTDAEKLSADWVTWRAEESGKSVHLYGTVKETLLADSYRVWILAEKNGEIRAFEAFPICEAELLEEKQTADNGWSAYLDPEITKDAGLSLLVESGEKTWLIGLD